jgi:hypothetical protein
MLAGNGIFHLPERQGRSADILPAQYAPNRNTVNIKWILPDAKQYYFEQSNKLQSTKC